MMPKRIIDGESLWRSKKLLDVLVKFRGEYANLLPLAEDSGRFEADPHLIWSLVYAYNRPDIQPETVAEILDAFEAAGMLEQFEVDGRPYATFIGMNKPGRLPGPTVAPSPDPPSTLRENLPLESILRNRCEEIFGEVEDRKLYAKDLKSAVKRKGYDAILAAFEVWSQAGYVGRKPMLAFLKGLDSVPVAGFTVLSSSLRRVEDAIAVHSGNTVFLHTSQKAVLAGAINEYGEDEVIDAFKDFFAQLPSDSLQFAGHNFCAQVGTRVRAARAKREMRAREAQLLEIAARQAHTQAAQAPQEETFDPEL